MNRLLHCKRWTFEFLQTVDFACQLLLLLGIPDLSPAGHLPCKKRHIPVTEGLEQALYNMGTGTMFAGYYQFGVPIRRDLRQPQQYFPGLGMNCAGNVPLPELEDGTDIDDRWRIF